MALDVQQAADLLRKQYDSFFSKINAGKIEDAITSHYTPNAYVTGHETGFVSGHTQLIDLFKVIHEKYKDMHIHIVETRVAGDDCIYNLVTATSRLADSGDETSIKSQHVWLKIGSDWKCDTDVFTLGGF